MTTKEKRAEQKAVRDAAKAAEWKAFPGGDLTNIQTDRGVIVRFDRGEEPMRIRVRTGEGVEWIDSAIFIEASDQTAKFILALVKRYNACVQRANAMAANVPALELLDEIQVAKAGEQP